VIRSFRDKALERFFATGDGRRLSVQNTRRIANILRALDDASRPEDMNLPGFRFHALVGRDKGRYAVNASGNWRKAMPSTSIWKTITEDRLDDQEAPEARLAAHASWRTSARGDFAGA
jgi:proteic killer suppression protein